MGITFDFIHGLAFGIEHISKDTEQDIDESVVIISIAFIRAIIWTGDHE